MKQIIIIISLTLTLTLLSCSPSIKVKVLPTNVVINTSESSLSGPNTINYPEFTKGDTIIIFSDNNTNWYIDFVNDTIPKSINIIYKYAIVQ